MCLILFGIPYSFIAHAVRIWGTYVLRYLRSRRLMIWSSASPPDLEPFSEVFILFVRECRLLSYMNFMSSGLEDLSSEQDSCKLVTASQSVVSCSHDCETYIPTHCVIPDHVAQTSRNDRQLVWQVAKTEAVTV